jgi:hypothetical protein
MLRLLVAKHVSQQRPFVLVLAHLYQLNKWGFFNAWPAQTSVNHAGCYIKRTQPHTWFTLALPVAHARQG